MYALHLDSLRESSVNIGTIQRGIAWPLRKDDTHKSRSVNMLYKVFAHKTILTYMHGARSCDVILCYAMLCYAMVRGAIR